MKTTSNLSSIEKNCADRTENVLARAMEVFEDQNAANIWLSQPNRSLGGEVPLALLDTQAGYQLVLDTLGRIEHGVVS